jgi:hypothetical protein
MRTMDDTKHEFPGGRKPLSCRIEAKDQHCKINGSIAREDTPEISIKIG